jgi:hypothetical protein
MRVKNEISLVLRVPAPLAGVEVNDKPKYGKCLLFSQKRLAINPDAM